MEIKRGWKINKSYKIELYDKEDRHIRTLYIKALSKQLAVIKLAFMSRKNKTLGFDLTMTNKALINGEVVFLNNKVEVIEED